MTYFGEMHFVHICEVLCEKCKKMTKAVGPPSPLPPPVLGDRKRKWREPPCPGSMAHYPVPQADCTGFIDLLTHPQGQLSAPGRNSSE